jgi:hypothetical protein
MLARAVFLLLALALSGCSAIKVTYNHADFIAGWMADDYFELNNEQKDAFRDQFQRFHAWHRSTELSEYASLLAEAQRRLRAGVNAGDITWAIDSMKARYRAMVIRGYIAAARILTTLSDEQFAATRRQFEKSNRKFAREYGVGASADEQRRLRAKRVIERIEHWTGTLSAAQEARITALSRALPLVTDLRLQDRIRRQQEFLALLEARRPPESFAPKLRDWLVDWDRSRAPEYEAALARFVDASAKMYLEIFALLTPEQRNHVSERLQRYISAFKDLAQEAPRTAMEAK